MSKPRAALLIDSENIQANYLGTAINALEGQYSLFIRQVFCDVKSAPNGWTDALCAQHAIRRMHCPPVTSRKNGADIALAIAAMDMMQRGDVDAIAIMSSDSDFSPLALRLREAGITALCLGEGKAPDALRIAFNRFIDLSIAALPVKPEKAQAKPIVKQVVKPVFKPVVKPVAKQAPPVAVKSPLAGARTVPNVVQQKIQHVLVALDGLEQDVSLAALNARLRCDDPEFSARKYGFASISKLLKTMNSVALTNGNRAARLAMTVAHTQKA